MTLNHTSLAILRTYTKTRYYYFFNSKIHSYNIIMQVDVYWYLDKHDESRSFSSSARNWAVAAFACGIAIVAAVIFVSTLWVFSRPSG